jgi:uncharacterized protein with NRDE domain
MCLVALAIDQSRRFPLVVAANRDEYFDRATQRLAWWSPGPGRPDILGGRDLQAGGTWLGLTAAGRMAFVTNVRQGHALDPDAPSRGEIVSLWLRGDLPHDRFWAQVALSGYNPFNLIAADFQRGECFSGRNDGTAPVRLQRGLFGLSNASLDTPWPKVTALKDRLAEAMLAAGSADSLAGLLFEALADPTPAPDPALPSTGVPRDWERVLSSAFIRSNEQRYGTRSSTLVITERVGKRLVTHVLERSFGADPSLALLRRTVLRDWPPRYSMETPAQPAAQLAVTDADLAPTTPPARRRRSLLPPVRRPARTAKPVPDTADV